MLTITADGTNLPEQNKYWKFSFEKAASTTVHYSAAYEDPIKHLWCVFFVKTVKN